MTFRCYLRINIFRKILIHSFIECCVNKNYDKHVCQQSFLHDKDKALISLKQMTDNKTMTKLTCFFFYEETKMLSGCKFRLAMQSVYQNVSNECRMNIRVRLFLLCVGKWEFRNKYNNFTFSSCSETTHSLNF